MDVNQMLGGSEDEFPTNSAINTTPLVDIMLVLLIIFLITVPVVVGTVKVELPPEANIPTQTKPENINIAVDRDGNVYWNQMRLDDEEHLMTLLRAEATKVPQPEVHIRGDLNTQYGNVGEVIESCQRAGIAKVGFITEPAGPA
ncbi:MAG: biopolymer transporter ExbD [Hyphomonas sp.]|jgi:biopolymer transport protein ExbD|nr:biopolymer transporter ExbD [Hyphomonas sp.]